jgi:hypothetical protein
MKSTCAIFIPLIILISSLNCTQKNDLAHDQSIKNKVKDIYALDKGIRNSDNEIKILREEAYQAERNKQFEKAHELKGKADKTEKENKDLKVKLDEFIKGYEEYWDKQSIWHQLALEAGTCYTKFDTDLDIKNTYGLIIKLHKLERDFRRFHLGSYIYYPQEISENYPLHQVEASPLFIEYRRIDTNFDTGDKKEVIINSYKIGFGVMSQAFGDTYLKLNLSGGFEQYESELKESNGPVVSYAMGLDQKITDRFDVGLEMSGTALWDKKDNKKDNPLFNLSTAAFLRILF